MHYWQLLYISSSLPYNDHMLCEPFLNMVFNSGVTTRAHWDSKDLGFCLVIPVGEWTGAWLGLYKHWLVWAPQSENLLWFLSNKITHFNMHLKGIRFSFVFSIDDSMLAYTQNGNHFNVNQLIWSTFVLILVLKCYIKYQFTVLLWRNISISSLTLSVRISLRPVSLLVI